MSTIMPFCPSRAIRHMQLEIDRQPSRALDLWPDRILLTLVRRLCLLPPLLTARCRLKARCSEACSVRGLSERGRLLQSESSRTVSRTGAVARTWWSSLPVIKEQVLHAYSSPKEKQNVTARRHVPVFESASCPLASASAANTAHYPYL